MRTIAFTLAITAAVSGAAQSPTIRWEDTGGPIFGQRDRVIVQGDRLLVGGRGFYPSRSLDGGRTWSRVADRAGAWQVFSASAVDIYSDTFDGMLRTSDLGDTWDACGKLPSDRKTGRSVRSIEADGNRVYAVVQHVGVFRSSDRCQTWASITPPVPLPPDAFVHVKHVNGSRVVVSRAGASYLSNDEGNTWIALYERIQELHAIAEGCSNDLLAGSNAGLYHSQDGGNSWISAGLAGRWIRAVAVRGCKEWFAVVQDKGRWTHSVVRSLDGGRTWQEADDGLSGHPIASLSVDHANRLYAAGMAGAHRWTADSRWEQLRAGASTASALAFAPWGETFAVGWGLHRMATDGDGWRPALLGHDAHIAAHMPGSSARSVSVTREGDVLAGMEHGVLRSRDRGQTWKQVGLVHSVSAFASLPDGTILAATQRGVFASTDGGDRWVERSIGLIPDARIIGFATAAAGAVYAAAMSGGIFQSSDQGQQWRLLDPVPASGARAALLVDGKGRLLAGTHSGLWRWEATDQRWQATTLAVPVEGGRPRRPAVVALVKDARGWLFAASENDGVFVSFDDGATWTRANDGLPDPRVYSLAADADGRVLAGTIAGVFRLHR
jgi:photosystem II stability/assembly factor-like uncharacterized protein